MTHRLTPQDVERLKDISLVRDKLARQQRTLDRTRTQLQALVRAERGKISQTRLAKAAGVTVSRICQIQSD